MGILDWNEWMQKHHIKLKGDENDNRTDAGTAEPCVQRTGMAGKSRKYAGSTGDCGIYGHEA